MACRGLLIAAYLLTFASAFDAQTSPQTPDIPARFDAPTATADYVRRDVMVPMRDGVRLFTVIVMPRGAKSAPIILTRTPYDAAERAARSRSLHMLATLPQGDEVFVADGYIRVFQDVRGKYGSEGDYVMTRPLKGPLNPTSVDHSTDAYDTMDWLVKNVPESSGRIGMLGSSYEGFTVVMALVNPHPALKVAAPMSPMVDGWMGDDWFHFGAFRNPQSFVQNIFFAKPGDYVKATQRVYHAAGAASFIDLPVAAAERPRTDGR
jgi:predicted acyl esterase